MTAAAPRRSPAARPAAPLATTAAAGARPAAPVPAGPGGRGGGHRAAAIFWAHSFSRAPAAVFWALLVLFILGPSACFLLLAVSPRLFDQGPQWLTLAYLRQTLRGATAAAVADSLWVSAAAAVTGALIGVPIAWLTTRTTMPGRRMVSGAMWLILQWRSRSPAAAGCQASSPGAGCPGAR